MPQQNNLCAFSRKPAQHYACFSADCTKCGWYKPEAERRRIRFKQRGLTLCTDGLYRFIDLDERPAKGEVVYVPRKS